MFSILIGCLRCHVNSKNIQCTFKSHKLCNQINSSIFLVSKFLQAWHAQTWIRNFSNFVFHILSTPFTFVQARHAQTWIPKFSNFVFAFYWLFSRLCMRGLSWHALCIKFHVNGVAELIHCRGFRIKNEVLSAYYEWY